MKIQFHFKLLFIISTIVYVQINTSAKAQSLTPQVIASAGAYSSNSVGSLSCTVGEAVTNTLTSGNHMLTQSFQQPFRMTINLKAFIQAYYTGSGTMQNVLYNEGVTSVTGNECDTVQLQLREANPPYSIAYSTSQVIKTDGTLTINGQVTLGASYYIVIKHRNALETWSANPLVVGELTNYDFTTSSNHAYGDNQVEVEPGVWAFYSGDIIADENIDLLDITALEADIAIFQYGYFATDINGDGNVDLLDSPSLEANINAFIYSAHP